MPEEVIVVHLTIAINDRSRVSEHPIANVEADEGRARGVQLDASAEIEGEERVASTASR